MTKTIQGNGYAKDHGVTESSLTNGNELRQRGDRFTMRSPTKKQVGGSMIIGIFATEIST